jgi:hypothetical protein
MGSPFEWIRYSNHVMVSKNWLGHAGWAGQFALANMETGAVAVFLSVVENQHGTTRDYLGPVIRMLESVTEAEFLSSA